MIESGSTGYSTNDEVGIHQLSAASDMVVVHELGFGIGFPKTLIEICARSYGLMGPDASIIAWRCGK